MLFNSYYFIFLYLPIVLVGFFSIARNSHSLAALWLGVASLFFYGWWNPQFVLLLLASVVFNYAMGHAISHAGTRETDFKTAKWLLTVAISTNLMLLFYYKYVNFFINTTNQIAGTHWGVSDIVLPLGISFFTFTQIAFLVDVYRGIAREYNFIHYLLFVTYFPHLIAGPVLHHKQMMPQFRRAETYNPTWKNFNIGIAFFSIGLCKKVLLADSLSEYATPVFNLARDGQVLMLFSAWIGSLAYAFQLYFDFSGYSDMAIGLSMMIGVTLPINFNSPYKSENIIEFWRRWHMTLSEFLRDYLYVPLGGNRKGKFRRHTNLMTTMLLGGLWHGANWTFVIWGGMHGMFLIINHAWQHFGLKITGRFFRVFSICLTFLSVLIAWIFFRSDSVSAALSVTSGLLGFNGVSFPASLSWMTPYVTKFSANLIHPTFLGITPELPTPIVPTSAFFWLAISSGIVWFLPNSHEIVSRLDRETPRLIKVYAITMGFLFSVSVMSFSKVSEFLYFQF